MKINLAYRHRISQNCRSIAPALQRNLPIQRSGGKPVMSALGDLSELDGAGLGTLEQSDEEVWP